MALLLLPACASPQRAPANVAPDTPWVHYGPHWQRRADGPLTVVDSPSDPACKLPGMARVEGEFLKGPVETLQNSVCTDWISKTFPQRCAVFDADRWHKVTPTLSHKHLGFCIDRFEFPNVPGENPVVMVNFYEARKLCSDQGKRLCTDEEWTFACEGEEGLPYPYGYVRDADKCNADRGWTQFDAGKLGHRDSQVCADELERLWKGLPSGTQPGCKSPFGVYDLTGNIDEWTENRISGGSFKGAQKGGYWGPVRARCRPATNVHNEFHMFYQQGTRCCSDL
jgi:hypothetical protein